MPRPSKKTAVPQPKSATEKKSGSPGTPKLHNWWLVDKNDPYELAHRIFDTVVYIEQDQRERRDRNIRCMRLYGNMDFVNIGPYGYSKTNTTSNLPENRVKYNIIASSTDTLAAKISKMKPEVTFLTGGGAFHVQERAKKLSKFIRGIFYANGVYTKHQAMFRDGLVFDVGALKHYAKGGEICSERVLPTEIFCDLADAMYGSPRSLYHVKFVHKEVLSAEYPEQESLIRESTGSLDATTDRSILNKELDYVVVIEAWHLPSGPDANDGRHVISVEHGSLVDDPYDRTYFPFTFSRWCKAMLGFYGTSLADRLTGNQVEINKMLRTIQRSFHLGSAFKIFLEYSARVPKEHLNNDIGSIVYYSGAAPIFTVPQTVHPEFFRHLDWLVKSTYEEAGISQLSATAKLPPGLDGGSGKALREYNDLETERFILVAQEYEASFLETARQYIDLCKEMKSSGTDLKVTAESKRLVESIKWSEVDLDHDEYVMQMFPTSSLPNTPAGKLAYVQELIQSGFIDQTFGLSLLEFPDTDGVLSLKTAPLDDIMDTLDKMLYKGIYNSPEPFQNLQLGINIMQSAYLKAKKDGAPEDRLDLVRTWIANAGEMMNQGAGPPQLPGGTATQAPPTGAANPQAPSSPTPLSSPQAPPPMDPSMVAAS